MVNLLVNHWMIITHWFTTGVWHQPGDNGQPPVASASSLGGGPNYRCTGGHRCCVIGIFGYGCGILVYHRGAILVCHFGVPFLVCHVGVPLVCHWCAIGLTENSLFES